MPAMLAHLVLVDAEVEGVDVGLFDVDVVEEALAQLFDAAVLCVGLQWVILVDVEDDDIAEAQPLFLMAACQFGIDGCERGASAQT